MNCINCGQPIRPIRPDEGYDPREYIWTHEGGGVLCDLEPLSAEPASTS